ncbi:PASTA domain-containing protein [Corynebacterium urealyticum]|uniref:PASTA domain-containing protein n=1 Tax=Corynebacterium urealyticum TaxID=43771 RepID=UPI00293E5CAC|nr:PASTA domain-containing protein [Corynebacterium urealyticum]WOH95450.1 PASTA domain-containing protein [Corynebacterium urealyticum]
MEPQPGSYLDDRYHLGAKIAKGGMSTVYHAVDTRLDREVAVKIMNPELATDPTFRTRFEREARAVAKLTHPDLVNVFDQGEDGPFVFLVMELVDGGSLRELLRERGPMPPHAALSVMEPVLTALSVAHTTGMIHRDVKPDNVLISANHQVKLADFGLVRAVATGSGEAARTSATGQVIGTVAYLSPEQVQGQSLGAASDVYSAGVLLYELLTGETPFSGGSPVETALSRLTQDVPAPSEIIDGVPPEIDDLVLRACQRAPEDRFADGSEFLAAVRQTAAELQLPAFRVPVPADSAVQHALAGSSFTDRLAWDDEAMSTRAVTLDPAAGTDEAGDTAETHYAAQDQAHETSETALVDPYGDYSPAEADQGYDQWADPGHQWAEPGEQWAEPAQPQGYGQAPGYAEPQYYPAAPAGYPAQQSAGYPAPVHRPAPPPAPTKKLSNRSTIKGLLWTAIITALVIAIGLGGWWLTSGRYGQIPSVVGLDREAAVVKVEDAGFVSQVDEQFSDDHPAKKVMGTDPPFGERAPKGSQVSVLVSLGVPTVPIPGETDTAETYSAKLTSRTLVAEIGEEVYSDDAKKGTVAEVSPSPGSEVRTGSTVTIHVSRGPKPVRVPGVAGQKLDRAKKTLESAGLKVGKTIKEFDPDADPGTVLRTTPSKGTEVPSKSEVTIVVNNATEVPDITGLSKSEAIAELRDAGLDPVDDGEVFDADVSGGDVASQSPEAGTVVDPSRDTQVKFKVSNAESVPFVLGMRAEKAREKLEDAGFEVEISGSEDGLVWSQSPNTGRKAQKGDTVRISTF